MALRDSRDAFSASPELTILQQALSGDGRIGVDRSIPVPTDRLLTLTVPWDDLMELGPKIADLCERLGLIMFDTQYGRLVVPRTSTRPWPEPRTSVPSRIREAIADAVSPVHRDGDASVLTERVRTALGGVDARSLMPSDVRLPFTVPASLRFAVPVAVPPGRQTKAALKRYREDLRDERADVRRAAALALAGWSTTPDIEVRLAEMVRTDPDGYVRAVAALALAVQSDVYGPQIEQAAADAVRQASDRDTRWAGVSASIALLALSIIAVRGSDRTMCDGARSLAQHLTDDVNERERATALMRLLDETCGR